MKHLSRSAVILLIALAVFYNIERLDLGQVNPIDIASIVYVLGLLAAISVIAVPILQRSGVVVSIFLWAGIYVLAKLSFLFFFDGRPLLGGVYTYLAITELALLLIVVWSSHNFAAGLHEFAEAVKRTTFSDSDRQIRKFRELDEDIQVEMFRCRHNHHPLSIILIKPDPDSIQATLHRLAQEVQQKMLSGYVINSMAQTLRKYLRPTDLILEQRDQGRFIIVCPETNAADSKLVVEYIQCVAAEQLGTSIAYGMATFPDEAVTFEELVHRAESALRSSDGKTTPLTLPSYNSDRASELSPPISQVYS
jgi:GGDEF domain-containing protein